MGSGKRGVPALGLGGGSVREVVSRLGERVIRLPLRPPLLDRGGA